MSSGATYLLENTIWMSWNVGLALIPFFLSRMLFRLKTRRDTRWIIGVGLFVLFLPNAAYIITDIVHFRKAMRLFSDPVILSLAALQFILLELAGYWLFVTSYRRFERFFAATFTWDPCFLRVVVFLIVSAGVTIGRMHRLNSWDVLFAPGSVWAIIPSLLWVAKSFFSDDVYHHLVASVWRSRLVYRA